jgi:hypothetical protein
MYVIVGVLIKSFMYKVVIKNAFSEFVYEG